MKKKLLAILLTVCMVLSMAPAALAADSVFTDVKADDWFADEVKYVYDNGLMNGVGDNAFDPSGTVTRAMVWTTLARLDGVNTAGSDPWWLAGQQWAMENEISDGTMAENNITREQLVTMIWRYAKYIDMDVSEGEDTNILSYTDALDVNEWAISAMQWACAVGIINGIDGALQPQGDASRAMLAAILYRFVEEVMPGEEAPEPSTPVVPNYPSIPVHFHSYTVSYTSNNDGTHVAACACGATNTEDCEYGDDTVCDKCTYDKGAVAVIGTSYYATLAEAIATVTDATPVEIVVLKTEETATVANIEIPGGSNITLRGVTGTASDVKVSGQIATLSSTEGSLTIKDLTILVDSDIVDSTGISQTSKSAIALWGNQTVTCENVTFDMSLADSSAISGWWDTGIGTTINVKNCVFNCNGQRPIRTCGNVSVEGCTFNDPYRYAIQLTGKAGTATELENAVINFKNNTIVNGANGKNFVYGIQLEGETYGCNDLVINGSGNTINAGEWDTNNESVMYYCECGKVEHATVIWNTEVAAKHDCVVSDADELATAVAAGKTNIWLNDGEYNVKDCGGKTLTISGSKGAILKVMNEGEDGCDYGFGSAGSGVGNITFNGVTIDTTANTGNYKGYAYMKGTFNNCNFVGAYSLNNANDFVFNNCTFDFKNGYFWTWGAKSATFNNCIFNGNSKAILAHGWESTVITIKGCTFAATEKGYASGGTVWTAAIEIDPAGSNTYTINISDSTINENYAGWTRIKDGSTGHVIKIDGKLPVAEGLAIDPETGAYEISSAAGLFNFAKQVNEEGNNFSGKTVKLVSDIDLANATWTPIGQTGATEFRGVFDGQNYTISNLNVDSSAQTGEHYSSGLFGWSEAGAQIKNVKIEGATIKGNHNVAVIVGYTYSDKITNCHVTNAVVVCAHANNDACGDKAGIVGGYVGNEACVTDCSATDCTVTAGRDAGQLIGCGYNVSLSNCSADNVTVTAGGDCTGNNINEALIGRVMP
ncbi:S-layer homology domain-containing protein [Lawsonibacter celer]|uniref:S-layer homology domain-containing protein n=1 Tax=Lawsonibacter celer TaxID=2986526 RepID=UPI001644035E|nr:S-layer homology domain-containing protein [Lawsonibacter celer]